MAVGGVKKSSGRRSNDVFTFDEKSSRWEQTIPPMPTARDSPGVLSIQSALVVAGGESSFAKYTDTVEIFKFGTLQWYSTDPLPTPCSDISLNVIGNKCYAVGEFKYSSLDQVFYTSTEDLIQNAVTANQDSTLCSADSQSAWKTLANPPTSGSAAAVLAGGLLVIGGRATSEGGVVKKDVNIYSPSTNSWIYISDLPEPRFNTAIAVLSSTEILVIGGRHGGCKVNTVYRGTLHLKL